jgi:hypothetical protein
MMVLYISGRAARRGDQWRNVFCSMRVGERESTNLVFRREDFAVIERYT